MLAPIFMKALNAASKMHIVHYEINTTIQARLLNNKHFYPRNYGSIAELKLQKLSPGNLSTYKIHQATKFVNLPKYVKHNHNFFCTVYAKTVLRSNVANT